MHKAYFCHKFRISLYNQKVLGEDYNDRINKILTIINIPHINYDTNVIKENVITSKTHLDDIRKNSIQHREQFLIDQAIAMELTGNLTRSKALMQLKHIEAVRYQFKKLRIYMDKHTLTSPTTITITKQDGSSEK